MFQDFFIQTPIWLIGSLYLVVLAAAAEGGFRLQRYLDRRSNAAENKGGTGQILGVALGLMSLLLSFTFSLSVSRFDTRRVLVLEEANAIGTAYQQAQILPAQFSTPLTRQLRDYAQTRVAFFDAGIDQTKLADIERRTSALQASLWSETSRVMDTLPNRNQATALMTTVGHMFDVAPARKIALAARIPNAVLIGLSLLLVASATMLGAVLGGHGRRHMLLSLLLLALLAATITLIIDIDRPRRDHVRVDQAPLLDLRETMLSVSDES